VPAGEDMREVENMIVDKVDGRMELREAIADLPEGRWDAVIIDCPPNLGQLTQSALIACHGVIVPIPMEALPFKGFNKLIDAIMQLRKNANPTLAIQALFETMSDPRTTLAQITRGMVDDALGVTPAARQDALLDLRIRRSIPLGEAPGLERPRPVIHYKPDSHGATDYRALAAALVHREIV
jgi:chromosome partitioning protein